MNEAKRCSSRSPATARRCTLRVNHQTDHERRRRSGGLLEQWPRTAADADHRDALTAAELLEHLRDLIELAKNEGFGAMVGSLERADREIRGIVFRGARHKRARPDRKFWEHH